MMIVHIKDKLNPKADGTEIDGALLTEANRISDESQKLLERSHKTGLFFVCQCSSPGIRMTPVLLQSGRYTIRNLDVHAHDCPLFSVMGEGGRDSFGNVNDQLVASGGDRPSLFEGGYACRWLRDLSGRGAHRVETSIPSLAVLMRTVLSRAFSTYHVPYGRAASDAALLYRIKKTCDAYTVEGRSVSSLFEYGADHLARWIATPTTARSKHGELLIWADLLPAVSREKNRLWIHGHQVDCNVVWSFGWPLDGHVFVVMAWQAFRERPTVCVLYPVERTKTAILPYSTTTERVLISRTVSALGSIDDCYLERPMIPRWDTNLTTVVMPPTLIVTHKSNVEGQARKKKLAIWLGTIPTESSTFADSHIQVEVAQMTADRVELVISQAITEWLTATD